MGIGDPARSAAALAFAFEEAEKRGASLIAVHAWDSPQGEIGRATWALATPGRPALEEEAARRLTARWPTGRPSTRMSRSAATSYTLTRDGHWSGSSARADLVVIGRQMKRGALPGAGAVRHAVLNHAHGPVVTVPSS